MFLTGMAFAALLSGVVVRALRGQIEWLAERAQRLEIERDQQASLAAASERARIAREMHDVVSHNLQVMVTLADAAGVAQRCDPDRATEAMAEVAGTGRQAMTDMRHMLGLLRDDSAETDLRHHREVVVSPPQPRIDELDALVDRVRATGLSVVLEWEGDAFGLSDAAELTVYRIVQEALTNALKHAASADSVQVALTFNYPDVSLCVTDNGSGSDKGTDGRPEIGGGGHGLANMTARAAAFNGVLNAGPMARAGWRVETTLRGCSVPARV